MSKLSSPMISAECQNVSGFHFEGHFIKLCSRVPPYQIVSQEWQSSRQIFYSLFELLRTLAKRELREKILHHETESIPVLIKQFRQNSAEYDELRRRGHSSGMSQHREGMIIVEQWVIPEKELNLIVQLLSANTSKKSLMSSRTWSNKSIYGHFGIYK